MKMLILSVLVLIVAGATAVHYYPEQVEHLLGRTPLKELTATSKPLYQWSDEQGQWHMTDKPPPEGVPYEVKQYPLDANVVPAFQKE